MNKFTPGPWEVDGRTIYALESAGFYRGVERFQNRFSALVQSPRASIPELEANALLISAAPELLEALHEARRAIGDHYAPNDCYATGPVTGDSFRDLVQCPACSAIAMYDAAIAKARGGA